MTGPTARGKLRLAVVAAILWGAAASGVVGWQVQTGRATAHRAAEVASALADATCPFNRDLASLPVAPQTGEIGRRIVRDAAAAYQRVCVPRYGPLPPVDPDAYRPAPSSAPPTSTSTAPRPAPTPTTTPSSQPPPTTAPGSPASPPDSIAPTDVATSHPVLPDPGGPPAPRPPRTTATCPQPSLCVDVPGLPICI